MISLDQEHGTGMHHMASALATHPVTQVGHTARTVIVDKIKNANVTVCVNNNMKTNLVLALLQVRNKPHDEVQFVCLFLSLLQSQTILT